ncbi:MAG: leucine-rich repeat protein [Lachnospiraceae bacterium]|nr:leucine-rich repeat protein [Lachnospiraceae bacterium]
MMKTRRITGLLAMAMTVSLAGCGGGEAPATQASTAQEAPAAPVAVKNELDQANPIPSYSGSLSLTETTFGAQQIAVATTADMSISETAEDVTVASADGTWSILFRPFGNHQKETLINNISNYYVSAGLEVFPDRSEAKTNFAGFDAEIFARNIDEQYYNAQEEEYIPSVNIILDYGDTIVGEWAGMRIRLQTEDYAKTPNIYEVLAREDVRAVLNNFRIIEGDAGQTLSASGITVTFPSRWGAHDTDPTGPWAGIYGESVGAVYFSTATPSDPSEAAAKRGGETFDWSCGGTEYTGEIYNWKMNPDDEDKYTLSLFAPFSNDVCLSVKLILKEGNGDPEVLKSFIETDTFRNMISSVSLDESGLPVRWTSVDDSGLVRTAEGIISGYEGTDAVVEIPAVISGVEITGIAPGVFMNNNTITSVKLPETMEHIGTNAFRNCANLQTVDFGGTQSIGQTAFAECANLRDVELPERVTSVGPNAFLQAGSGSFTALGGTSYADSCFENSTFESITIGDRSDLSASGIFFKAQAREITLGKDIPSLGMGCFGTTEQLRNVTLSEGLESIGDSCFAWTSAPFIRIPEGVREIGAQGLVTENAVIILPSTLEYIAGLGVQGQVVMLLATDVELEESAIETLTLLLPTVYGEEDFSFPLDSGHVSCKNVRIAMDATFAQSDAMDEYLVGQGYDTISWIGISEELFRYHPDDFTLEEGIITSYTGTDTEICTPVYSQDGKYYGYRIGEGAFAGSGVRSIALYSGVQHVQNGAFRGCESLTDLWFSTDILNAPTVEYYDYGDAALADIPASATVHLPASLTDAERKEVEDFLKSKGLPDGVTFDYYSLR